MTGVEQTSIPDVDPIKITGDVIYGPLKRPLRDLEHPLWYGWSAYWPGFTWSAPEHEKQIREEHDAWLAGLTSKIKALHDELSAWWSTPEVKPIITRYEEHVRAIGNLLVEAKGVLPRGRFDAWVVEAGISRRSAYRYIAIVKNPDPIADDASDSAKSGTKRERTAAELESRSIRLALNKLRAHDPDTIRRVFKEVRFYFSDEDWLKPFAEQLQRVQDKHAARKQMNASEKAA
jgi:hypothetical protein